MNILELVKPLTLFVIAGTMSMNLFADNYEPPVNPYLADSPWPMSHRTPYAQGSSPLPGPKRSWDLRLPDYVSAGVTNITLSMSPAYSNGKRVYWGSSIGSVYKIKASGTGLKKFDQIEKPSGGFSLEKMKTGTSGAYTLVDYENTFFTVDGDDIVAYQDSIPGEKNSPIMLARTFGIPSSALREEGEAIVGMNMTWDGYIAFATKWGTVGVVDRYFNDFHFVQLSDEQEEVSNSIAVDEDGGIYVVTSEKMYRVQWTGSSLSLDEADGAWEASYEVGSEDTAAGRLGAGSGSTPSLMGSGSMDKFVVITDGQQLSHLVLFWRDEIPEDWEPIAPGKDRRIAAEVPVDFGDSARTQTVSEQSVLVRGYGAVVVSNDYRNVDNLPSSTGNETLDVIMGTLPVAFSQLVNIQPWGVHKLEWNPATRTLETAWVNNKVSCPNAIPTMSAASNMFYCVGARNGAWTIEGINWTGGEHKFSKFVGFNPLYNSFYAATQIGENGTIVFGTALGVVELDPR